MGVKEHIAFIRQFALLEWKTAFEYRVNFLVQSIGMFVNNFFWLFFWFLFFQRFSMVNGWDVQAMFQVLATLTLSYGLVNILWGNWSRVARKIEQGELDYYLTLPKNVLAHALAKFNYSGLGDFLFGVLLSFFVIPLKSAPLYALLLVNAALVMIGWAVLTGSLAFYFGRFEPASRAARESMMMFTNYPFSVFTGWAKFILLFIIPAGFVTGIPVTLLTAFSWKWLFITLGFTTVFFSFSVWFFYRGLRRYESGNVMVMRG